MVEERPSKWEEALCKRIRSKENGEQLVGVAEKEICLLCDELDLSSSTAQVAKAIYRRSLEKKFIENRSVGQVSAASVYAASRIESDVRSLDEVSQVSYFPEVCNSKRIVQRVFSEMSRQLNLKVGPVKPESYVHRFVEDLKVGDEVEAKAKQILEASNEEILSGKSPAGVASGAVYATCLICNHKRTQKEVASVSNVNVTTIRDRYQELIKDVGIVD